MSAPRRPGRSAARAASAAPAAVALPALIGLWALAAPPLVAAAAQEGDLPWQDAALDGPVLEARGLVSFRASAASSGTPRDAMDGRAATTFVAAAPGPAFLEVRLDRPRAVRALQVAFGNYVPVEWTLEAGQEPGRLEVVAGPERAEPRAWSSRVVPRRPLEASVWRLTAVAVGPPEPVAFAELALVVRQVPESLRLVAPSRVVAPEGDLPLHAEVTFDGGRREGSVLGLEFVPDEHAPFRLEPGHPTEPRGVTVRRVRDGEASVRARLRGRGTEIASPAVLLRCDATGAPDPAVAWIERLPRARRDDPRGGRPREGEALLLRAFVRNEGTADAPRVAYRWTVDGREVAAGWTDGIRRFGLAAAELRLPWSAAEREVRFEADPDGLLPEPREDDGARVVLSDALRLEARIDRPLLDAYRAARRPADPSCLERLLGEAADEASAALRAAGVGLSLALDRVVVVDAGAPPPAPALDEDDGTADLRWILPASALPPGAADPAGTLRGPPGSLLRRLALSRGAPDYRALEVPRAAVRVPGAAAALPDRGDGLVHRPSAPGVLARDAEGLDPLTVAWLRRHADARGPGGPLAPGKALAVLPARCLLRLRDAAGAPLDGAAVRAWRRAPRADGGGFDGDPVLRAVARDGGLVSLGDGTRDAWYGEGDAPADPAAAVLLVQATVRERVHWLFVETTPWNLAALGGASSHEVVVTVGP